MKSIYLPISVLALVVALSLWNGAAIGDYTEQWISGTERSENAAAEGDWDTALAELEAVYDHWNTKQTYLHIVEVHGELDAAEASFQRALACADTQDETEFRCEIRELLSQFRLLAEMEQVNIRNIL